MLLLPLLSLILAPAAPSPQGPPHFEDHFLDRTMRVDLVQFGDAERLLFAVDRILEEGAWPGNPRRPIDESGTGMYFVKVHDHATDDLLYSRGFATLFGEYRTTTSAKEGLNGAFRQGVRIPFPKRTISFVIEGRGEGNRLEPIFRVEIDPENVNIVREAPHPGVVVREIAVNGTPHGQVDIVLVSEGYTSEDRDKFWEDAARFAEVILHTEPFARRRADVSIRAAFFASAESGVDQPRKGIFRNTAIDAAFNALDLDRYLLVDDGIAMRDIAAAAPYDHLIVLANSTRYGGGGIFGDYCISTVDHARSEFVVMHEFGHSFANLADEYFSAEVAYNEFFPPGQEPHEPNITALLDPQDVKWKHLLTPGIPIPTPWGQEEIDALEARVQQLRAESDQRGEHREQIRALEKEKREIRERYRELYRGKIGVFEGAGYSPKGLYRSEIHVGMFHEGSYGPVSEEAIEKVIDQLTAVDS